MGSAAEYAEYAIERDSTLNLENSELLFRYKS